MYIYCYTFTTNVLFALYDLSVFSQIVKWEDIYEIYIHKHYWS